MKWEECPWHPFNKPDKCNILLGTLGHEDFDHDHLFYDCLKDECPIVVLFEKQSTLPKIIVEELSRLFQERILDIEKQYRNHSHYNIEDLVTTQKVETLTKRIEKLEGKQ